MEIIYVNSSIGGKVQGTYEDVKKQYGKEWNIIEHGKGNGNWLLTKKSDVLVDGKSYRKFVLEQYGRKVLNPNLVNKFRKDVESGKIKL